MIEREIRFRTLTSVLHNDFRMRGAGTIRISPEEVAVKGRRREGFGSREAELTFTADRVFDATSYGKLVWFMVDPPAGETEKPRRMAIYAKSDADAQAIFDALPRRMSPDRAVARAEEDTFVDQLARATPRVLVTPALIAINVLVFLAMVADGAGLLSANPAVHIKWGSNFGPLTASGEWWRLVTNTFLHFGLLHIALNMWALFDAGRITERLFGHARFLAIYLVSGIGGSVASLAWNPQVNSAGASGAVFGVIGALLVYLLDPRNGVPMSVMRQHRLPLLVFIGYSLVYGFSHGNIDNAAHLGGLAMGVLGGLAWPLPLDRSRTRITTVRSALILAVFASVIATSAHFAMRRADGINEEARFRGAIGGLAASERNLNAMTQASLDALQRGRISREEAADRLRELAGAWSHLNGELVSIRLPADSTLVDLRTQLIRLSGIRAQGLSTLAEALPGEDAQRIREALVLLVESRKIEANVQRALAAALQRQ